MTLTQQRVKLVLDRLSQMACADEQDAECIANELEYMLEEFKMDDFFGTEGQLDPRGDHRNGEWSMTSVEGIDDLVVDD